MTPLDDELRRALAQHASVIAPSPDPMAGIDGRVSRIRRRRTAVAVAGAAAAVAVVALVVPGVIPDRGTTPPQLATSAPTPSTSNAVLDPANPWVFRGTPLPPDTLARFRTAWAAKYRDSGAITPLWAQVYEPSGQAEAAIVASNMVGFIRDTSSGAEVLFGMPLVVGTTALQFALPGDEVPRLVVVAAPEAKVEYAPNGTAFEEIFALYPPQGADPARNGTGQTALEGDLSKDRVRVTSASGQVVYDEPAGDPASSAPPQNVLDWPSRGEASVGPSVHDLGVAFTRAMGRSDGTAVEYRPLFTSNTDSGVRYTMGQAWFSGDTQAYSVSYATGGTDGPQFFLGPVTPTSPPVLAFLVGSLPGTSVDELVVIPQPTTGQVSYDDDANGSFRPIRGQDYLDGVVLIDRAKDATNDRLEVLNGNGDLDNPNYRGPLTPLLCGIRECG